MNGGLVGKRRKAIRSPYARRYCMMSALSSIFVIMRSLVLSSSGSLWVGVLSVVRSLVKYACTRAAVDSASSCTSSAH